MLEAINEYNQWQPVRTKASKLQVLNYYYNPDTGEYEVGTSGTGTGQEVEVTNFPSSYPVAKVALTASDPTYGTVGITSAELVPANASRKGLILVNATLNTVSIAFGTAAVLNSGITLTAGGVYTMGEYDYSTAQVRAIASLAGTVVSVQEFV